MAKIFTKMMILNKIPQKHQKITGRKKLSENPPKQILGRNNGFFSPREKRLSGFPRLLVHLPLLDFGGKSKRGGFCREYLNLLPLFKVLRQISYPSNKKRHTDYLSFLQQRERKANQKNAGLHLHYAPVDCGDFLHSLSDTAQGCWRGGKCTSNFSAQWEWSASRNTGCHINSRIKLLSNEPSHPTQRICPHGPSPLPLPLLPRPLHKQHHTAHKHQWPAQPSSQWRHIVLVCSRGLRVQTSQSVCVHVPPCSSSFQRAGADVGQWHARVGGAQFNLRQGHGPARRHAVLEPRPG